MSGKVYGYMTEFEGVDPFVAAVRRVRKAGYERWDAMSPFPIHGMEREMGIRRTILPFMILGSGVTGCGLALLMQWWMNAHDYPIVISGKPLWSIPANIPVTFELTVLFSAFAAVFGMLALNKLPELNHPVFQSERFKRVTTDRFFIVIEASDPSFDAERTRSFIESLGGAPIEVLEEETE